MRNSQTLRNFARNSKEAESARGHKKARKEEKKESEMERKKAELTFPTTIRINHYGFMSINKPLMTALGWQKDVVFSVVKNPDGSAMIRKA